MMSMLPELIKPLGPRIVIIYPAFPSPFKGEMQLQSTARLSGKALQKLKVTEHVFPQDEANYLAPRCMAPVTCKHGSSPKPELPLRKQDVKTFHHATDMHFGMFSTLRGRIMISVKQITQFSLN
jgi:hypothetical protein